MLKLKVMKWPIRTECLFTIFSIIFREVAQFTFVICKEKCSLTTKLRKYTDVQRLKQGQLYLRLLQKAKKKFSLKNPPFSLATDGSNNTDSKFYPMATYFNGQSEKIENSLLVLSVLKQ